MKFIYYKRGLVNDDEYRKRHMLSINEIHSLRNEFPNALYIRNLYDFDCKEETDYYCIVLDRFYDIDELPSKSVRKNLKQSLSTYTYRLVSKDEMLNLGYTIECEGSKRIGILPRYTEDEFKSFVESVYSTGGEFWVGFYTETMEPAMYELVSVKTDYVIECSERLSYRFTKRNPTYGLNWTIAKYYLGERGYRFIEAGDRSLTEHSQVQDFLLNKFCFRKAYCRMQVWIHPFLRILLGMLSPIRGLLSANGSLKALFSLYEMYKYQCKHTEEY